MHLRPFFSPQFSNEGKYFIRLPPLDIILMETDKLESLKIEWFISSNFSLRYNNFFSSFFPLVEAVQFVL